jgi:23S rRNA (uracil1939-C5)-methyltransferase
MVSKEKAVIDNLKHIGKVVATNVIPPIMGEPWHYRHRARLSVKYVAKKDSVLVGFREKASPFVANMQECLVLPKHISDLIPKLREFIYQLSIRDRIPQIEVAVGDKLSVLMFRIMSELSQEDEQLFKQFLAAQQTLTHPLQIWLQPGGVDSCYQFLGSDDTQLSYRLNKFNLEMPYYPTEFTQVNPYVNNQLVEYAISLLELNQNDEVIDFFCGIGNFTLAIATMAKNVLGIEDSQTLVTRAQQNASLNNLDNKTSYLTTNLFAIDSEWLIKLGKKDKWLIDPPRDGAMELIKSINPEIAPQKIIYVSCNPATLARDADILVKEHGYQLKSIRAVNMFPHTSHVESVAEFVHSGV